jgi:hypothetical protein
MPKQKDKVRAKRILDELMQDDIYKILDAEVRGLAVQIDSIAQSMRFENVQEYYSASAKIKGLSRIRDQKKSLMKERKRVILLINGILY